MCLKEWVLKLQIMGEIPFALPVKLHALNRICMVALGIIVSFAFQNSYVLAAPDTPASEKVQKYDYLILALSWSPTYCASSLRRGASAQCKNPVNRGFVLHGLWPQSADQTQARCPAGKAEFSKDLFEKALAIFPDLTLAQLQWQRHGQCYGMTADSYLDQAGKARAKLVVPERLRAPDYPLSLTPDEIRKEFTNTNSGLSSEAVSISCRKAELVDVLVCLKSDLSQFAACPQIVKRSCRTPSIQVPAFSSR